MKRALWRVWATSVALSWVTPWACLLVGIVQPSWQWAVAGIPAAGLSALYTYLWYWATVARDGGHGTTTVTTTVTKNRVVS